MPAQNPTTCIMAIATSPNALDIRQCQLQGGRRPRQHPSSLIIISTSLTSAIRLVVVIAAYLHQSLLLAAP